MALFKKKQLENIQIDYATIYANYGESNQRLLGPTKGGGSFEATAEIRDIEFDGSRGKTKGMQYIDSIEAVLKVVSLAITDEDLELAMPFLKKSTEDGNNTYICDGDSIGIVENEKYLKNITAFGKKTGGKYVKITLFNAMNEAPFSLSMIPKGEGEMSLEVYGHWESDDTANMDELFEITNVDSIE